MEPAHLMVAFLGLFDGEADCKAKLTLIREIYAETAIVECQPVNFAPATSPRPKARPQVSR